MLTPFEVQISFNTTRSIICTRHHQSQQVNSNFCYVGKSSYRCLYKYLKDVTKNGDGATPSASQKKKKTKVLCASDDDPAAADDDNTPMGNAKCLTKKDQMFYVYLMIILPLMMIDTPKWKYVR